MNYRRFGKLDWESSILGFGAMRLPVIDNDQSKINEPEAIAMIRRSIDRGVNYVDTAYPYHATRSEPLVGRALEDGYRQKVRLATKLPPWFVNTPADFDKYLNLQLERLQTDHIDFYLLHGMNKDFWPKFRDMDVLTWAEGAMADGRIGHLGFSFHDDLDVFKEIVDAFDWTFCQIQYNFMDVDYQAGTRGLRYAADKGLAVVVMEPLRGGLIVKEPPERAAQLWGSASRRRSLAEWALFWVWNHPEVTVALSGMTAPIQVEENLDSADRFQPGDISAEDLALIDQVRDVYRELSPIPCTNCQYCLPCPNGVSIPRCLELYNQAIMYGDPRQARFLYRSMPPDRQGDNCVACGECQEHCPQEIPIPDWLVKVHEYLGPRKK
ncbi:MAG: aldo/keto reductase [Proteobacteria bacterium]|nr:aldo/keto reductase [Pseudomonadota bacterium]